ncbi:hypothetical protein YPPY94_2027, partial [Yersinia pestis PY-94]
MPLVENILNISATKAAPEVCP